jgi:hypothetical protein
VVIGDKGYDSEDNHILVRDVLDAFSVIPARYEHVPIQRTCGKYRKQMKRGYSKLLYGQRNKLSIIKSISYFLTLWDWCCSVTVVRLVRYHSLYPRTYILQIMNHIFRMENASNKNGDAIRVGNVEGKGIIIGKDIQVTK